MVIARKIAYNVAISSVSKIISTILALVSIGLITRYLGKAGFGHYATVLAFLSFFSAFADLGLYSTATREISRSNANEEEIMGNVFSLRIIISLFVLFLSPAVVWFFPYPIEVKQAVVIIAGSFLFSSSYQVLNGIFQKNLAMDKVAISELSGKALQVLIIFLAIKFNAGFLWIVSSLFFSMFFVFSLIYSLSRKYVSFKWKIDVAYWKKFLKESYPLGISAFIGFVYFKIDTILLSILKSSSDVGIYNVAYKVLENITFFPAMVVGLIFPIMSRYIFSDKEKFREISDKTYKFFWIFVIPLIVGTLFLSGGIINLIGGADFVESVIVLRILVFAIACIFFSNFFEAILIAGNQQKKIAFIAIVATIFNVSFNLMFISKYSYLAAAIISVLTESFVMLGTFWAVKKKIDYFPKAEKISSIFLSGLVMAIYFFLFRNINFFLLAITGTLVYFISLWFTGALKKEDLVGIITKKEKNYAGTS